MGIWPSASTRVLNEYDGISQAGIERIDRDRLILAAHLDGRSLQQCYNQKTVRMKKPMTISCGSFFFSICKIYLGYNAKVITCAGNFDIQNIAVGGCFWKNRGNGRPSVNVIQL